jgi:glycogen operon protein
MGRSQRGNNNAYCQDNEISWVDWKLSPEDLEMLEFVRKVVTIRGSHPTFRRGSFFQGRPIKGAAIKDLTWLTPEGCEMTDEEWNQSSARCLGMFLAGDAIGEDDLRGRPVADDDFLLLLNSHHERIDFVIPRLPSRASWAVMLDTSRDDGGSGDQRMFDAGDLFPLERRSLALLIGRRPESGGVRHVVEATSDDRAASIGAATAARPAQSQNGDAYERPPSTRS